MKIVFLHYHLKTGGVTTVLKHQVNAVRNHCAVMVMTGELPSTPFPADTVLLPDLAYDTVRSCEYDPDQLARSIHRSILSRWKDGCDLIHVHNPTLAKNRRFLAVLKALQKMGYRLFLQCHDFAEDGRPQLLFDEDYPADCHYAVINSRDYRILLDSGLKPEGLHLLKNPVPQVEPGSDGRSHDNLVLYPVRAIRRKNIGEAILLSLFFKNGETLAITQPPNSPEDVASYQGWKTFSRNHHLNIVFEAGVSHDFHQLVMSSKIIITTSIMEGFGYCFLEPWLAGKLLWGRQLPDICADFRQNGINLDHMYSTLAIPLEWIGKDSFFARFKSAITRHARLFHFAVSDHEIRDAFDQTTASDALDFGLLDEQMQQQVLIRLIHCQSSAEQLQSLNPFLSNPGMVPDAQSLISDNKARVLCHYSPTAYRDGLLETYSDVIKSRVTQHIDRQRLLSHFFTPHRFSLLKWSAYAGS